ncbi:MAG: 4Fe-4S dicluster domain-containing protein [Proteobacteria bacterium]|nr:4Fe-4S dicluster domain-containing protein [Pseudomonadota bacterium]
MDRRQFLKIAGFSIAGFILDPSLDIRPKGLFANTAKQKITSYIRKWGMAINLDACAKKPGCRACIDACNIVHNVPGLGSPKEEVKWIWKSPYPTVFPEHIHIINREEIKNLPVMVLCNHCDNPPCVKVCPTKATWKREDGIVMMDYHRCIGCRYCMAACPYGARSFNWFDPRLFLKTVYQDFPTRTKGVVEKCNFCEERLIRGLLPACVEVCKENALIFGDLAAIDSDVRKILKQRHSIVRKPHLGTEPKVFYIL